MKLIPLYDNLLVLPDPPSAMIGTIYMPEQSQDNFKYGTVVSCGRGRILQNGELFPLSVRPGDRIRYDDYAGTKIEIDGVEYLHMREMAVVGILED